MLSNRIMYINQLLNNYGKPYNFEIFKIGPAHKLAIYIAGVHYEIITGSVRQCLDTINSHVWILQAERDY